MTKIAARRTLLTGAALAVAGVLIVGCTPQHPGSSASGPASAQATSTASAAASPTAASPAASSPAASPAAGATTAPAAVTAPTTTSPAGAPGSGGSSPDASVPGVIDCAKSLSQLEVRPGSLLLVCSDGTAGLQDLRWSHWGSNATTSSPGKPTPSATATATGELSLNTCNPNCAQNNDQYYPVQVTLSVVYSSSQGSTYFGQASLAWIGSSRPPAGTKTTYTLPNPSGA